MKRNELNTELLILPDGRILVQNLTQPMAGLLRQLNPRDEAIAPRAGGEAAAKSANEFFNHEHPDRT